LLRRNFPEISRYFANNGANLLVNIYNDAWYGVSSAPYQHLYMYSMRSVENGRATVRAANAGVSALIDSSGAVVSQTKLFEKTVAYYDAPLLSGRTVYMTVGDVAGYLPLLGTLALFFAALGRTIYRRFNASKEPTSLKAAAEKPRENSGGNKKGKAAKNGKR
jgi:apolipoprotein N-acyltransferase